MPVEEGAGSVGTGAGPDTGAERTGVANAASALASVKSWDRVSARLTTYAFNKLGRKSREQAKELAQEAIRRAFDPAYASWDPEKVPDVLRFLGSVVNGLIRNEFTSARATRDRAAEPEDFARLVDAADPESELAAREHDARAHAMLRERCANDVTANRLLDLIDDGIDLPRDQATAIGADITEIRNARRRLAAHAEAVARSLSGTREVA